MTRVWGLGFALMVLAGQAFSQETSTLVIDAGDAGSHTFAIELADTPEKIEQGLMERDALAADAGMLFDFGAMTQTSMWMKNTPLYLDMFFLNAQGKVVAIAHDTAPESERRISVGTPIRAVLEVNSGTAKALNIMPGAIVRHALFDNEIIAATQGE